MRKIIQILHGHSAVMQRPAYLVLCDDGSVWRQVQVENPPEKVGPNQIADPTYAQVWKRALEFDLVAIK